MIVDWKKQKEKPLTDHFDLSKKIMSLYNTRLKGGQGESLQGQSGARIRKTKETLQIAESSLIKVRD